MQYKQIRFCIALWLVLFCLNDGLVSYAAIDDGAAVASSLSTDAQNVLPTLGTSGQDSSGPFKPLIIKLKYLKADQMKSSLSTIIPENRIRIESAHNSLILMGSEDEYSRVRDVLTELDVPQKQVMFEAEVVEITNSDLNNLGVKWEWGNFPATSGNEMVGVIPVGPQGSSINYRATIDAMVNTENAKILANPQVATLDGQTARILIGDRLPVETKILENGVQQIAVNYIDVGIKLEVTPWVNEDGIITTRLLPEVSTNIATAGNNPSIRTRQAETTLRVKNGETIVIGGLIQREDRKNVIKVPLLGDIPIIGNLFRSTSIEKRETELIIFITPKILDSP
jgi:general secretion pathway protein D